MNYKLELENATWNSVANHRFWNAFRFGTLERACWAVRTMCTVCLVTKRCVWHVTLCVCIYICGCIPLVSAVDDIVAAPRLWNTFFRCRAQKCVSETGICAIWTVLLVVARGTFGLAVAKVTLTVALVARWALECAARGARELVTAIQAVFELVTHMHPRNAVPGRTLNNEFNIFSRSLHTHLYVLLSWKPNYWIRELARFIFEWYRSLMSASNPQKYRTRKFWITMEQFLSLALTYALKQTANYAWQEGAGAA